MGFEAPLALLALAAAGLPILAHLLRRRDLPRRVLPTIALLRRAEASSKRRVRLVDLLLLIARVLLIAMAALALAGPFFRVTLAYGDGTVASVVLVVDDSMSMTRADPELVETARARAREVIESLPSGSEVAVVLAGAPARVIASRTENLGTAARALDALPLASARGTDLAGALEHAERELAGARHAERRVLVLSDLAAHARAGDAPLPRGVEVTFERIGDEAPTRNAAVIAARATPDPTTPGMASVAVEVRASRELDGERLPLVLSRGADEIARETVEIEGGVARATLHARVSPDDPGGTVAIEIDDALDADDRRGVLLRPPSGARVLLVEGDRGGAGHPRFLARALDLAPEDGGAIRRRSVDPDTFATMDLSDSEVVILADAPAPSPAVAARLRAHVEAGGGLLIAPGRHFDARAFEARLGDLLPARPRAAATGEWAGPFPAPGAELLPAGSTGLAETHARQRIGLEDPDLEARTLLVFGDGSPALLSARRGDGVVALMATSLEDEWTDLPFRPGYLPFVVALVRELAPRASTPDSALAPGAPVTLRPPAGARRMVVLGPDGTEHEPASPDAPSAFEQTHAAGVYRVRVATGERALSEEPRLAFLVAPPPEESELAPGPVPEGSASRAPVARGAVVERPFARWLFLLVGLLALAEAGLRLRATHLVRRPA